MDFGKEKIVVFISLVAVLSGILLSCHALKTKYCWYDERLTLLNISGYSLNDLDQKIGYDKPVKIKELRPYSQVNSTKTWRDTVKNSSPILPPPYFLLSRWLALLTGDSLAAARGLSVFFFVLSLAFVFWITQKLINSGTFGLLCVSLFALSPLLIIYAQEARPYSMWTALYLWSWAALLSALEKNTRLSWLWYALAVALSFYTHLFSLLGLMGQGIYILFSAKASSRTAFLKSSLLGVVLFAPWFLLRLAHTVTELRWYDYTPPLATLVGRLIINPTLWLFDPGWYTFNGAAPAKAIFVALLLIAVYAVLAGYAYFKQKNIFYFFVCVCWPPLALLIFKDFFWGGQLSTIPRYFLPFNIGLVLLLAYGIWQLSSWKKPLGIMLLVIVLALEACSSWKITTSPFWWSKNIKHFYALQKHINQTASPLLITEAPIAPLLYLDYGLQPEATILRTFNDARLNLSGPYSAVFIYTHNIRQYPRLIAEYKIINASLTYDIPAQLAFGTLYQFKNHGK